MTERADFARLLVRHFSVAGKASEEQVELLWHHYALLERWNKVLNLTAIRSVEEAVLRHYCESLFVALRLPSEPVSVLDIGSGAGFPGIPMAIYRADCRFTLAESHQRKAAFLREATRQLPNVLVAAKRAEAIQEAFDWVVSRAVSWRDLRKSAASLGHTVGLLVSSAEAQKIPASEGWWWETPVPVPWSHASVLLLGSVCST
jgi:16S rRNA (guanine527-N7)-methyltransferase